jgi:hypothetical protein
MRSSRFWILLTLCGVSTASSPLLGTEFSGGSFQGFLDISQGLRRWVNPINTSENCPLDNNGKFIQCSTRIRSMIF